MEYMFMPLRRYATFSGRSRRKEYWMWVLFIWIGYIACMILDSALGLGGSTTSYAEGGSAGFNSTGGLLTILFMLATFIPGLAVSVRRLHDLGKSGWMLLIAFIPLLGGLYLLFLFVQPGTPGQNAYGADPKGPSHDKVFA